MNLKVAVVSSVYPYPNRGCWPGMERLVEGLAETMVKKGVDISVITSYRLGGDRDYQISPNGVKLLRVKSLFDYKPFGVLGLNTASFSSSTFGKYFKLLRDSDVIHVFGTSLVPIGPLKSALPPLLCFVPHFDLPKSLVELLYVPYANFLFYLLCRASDIVTAAIPPNSPQIEEFASFFKVPTGKIRFIYEGVDPKRFHPGIDTDEIQQRFGGHVVLFVGALIPRKGLTDLIEAAPLVAKEVPDVRFVFVGRHEARRHLENLARKLGVEKHVFFEGFVSEDNLPKYYGAADILCCPSLREGYSLPCLEAMACGTPVVATNLGTTSTIVGDTGILVEESDNSGLAQGIISLLKDSSLRRKLGTRAAKRVKENFTWEKIVERVTEIYKEAIELKKTAS